MGYQLGVDLGTTYTAAAVQRDGQITMATLGTRIPEIPTVVAYVDDGEVLIGEPAERRAVSQPERIAREFKRRVGDPVPSIVAGVPRSAESLMALVLRHVIAKVTEAEGGPPDKVVVTFPASWGPYKTAQLEQIFQLAGCPSASVLTEPEAAAQYYAMQARLSPNSTVAVFDFGGGTFDVAILRNGFDGSYQLLGEARGLERLGGVDLDKAFFGRVLELLELDLSELEDTAANRNAIARLRGDCVTAKEALSVDTATTVPVMLPGRHTEVRLTRQEFEDMIGPLIIEAIAAVDGAIEDAKLHPEDLTAILLVGGSSRIPLVSQLLSDHFGRPILVDSHPKHSIASGAALQVEPTVTELSPPEGLAPTSSTTEPPGEQHGHPPANASIFSSPASTDDSTRPAAGPASLETILDPPADRLSEPEVHLESVTRQPIAQRLALGTALVAVMGVVGLLLTLLGGDGQGDDPGTATFASTVDESVAGPVATTVSTTTPITTTVPPTTSSRVALKIGDEIGRATYDGLAAVDSLPDVGPDHPPQLAWQVASDLFTGPAGHGDFVYMSIEDEVGIRHLAAFNAETGSELWVSELFGVSSIIVTDKVVVAHWLKGLRFHDPETGELLGEMGMPSAFDSDSLAIGAAFVRDGRIIAVGGHGEGADATSFVVALDLATGQPAWTYEDQSLGWSPLNPTLLASTDGSTVVLGWSNAMVALDATSGDELWRSTELTGQTRFLVTGGVMVIQPEWSSTIGLDARTGEPRWEFTESTFPSYASDGTNLLTVTGSVLSGGSELQARRLATGDLVWTAAVPDDANASDPTIVIGGDLVYVVYDSGPAAAFRLSSGQLVWSSTLEGLEHSFHGLPIFVANGRLLILQDETVKVYE